MKSILALVPYTGSERLVQMTAAMLLQLRRCTDAFQVASIRAIANNPSRRLTKEELVAAQATQVVLDSNRGFGPGINEGISGWTGDLLILNNDLEFPQEDWLNHLQQEQLLDDRDNLSFIYAPRTNCTATREACKDGSEDKPAQRVRQISAYCWLVPAKIQLRVRERNPDGGFFPPAPLHNYGSDDGCAGWVRKLFGGTPFKVVHRAFVKHAKGQTAAETGDRPGTQELLKQLRGYLRSHNLP